jgi:Uma2 family endonuclease
MSITAQRSAERVGRPGAQQLPPLQSGDRLSVTEFVRRYEGMPPGTKAELIKGVVYVSSPVTVYHAESHPDLMTWLGVYKAFTPGVLAGDNATLRLDDNENQPQSDGHLRLDPVLGGQTRTSSDGYVEGAPELVAEVAVTSANYDLHDKLDVYRDHGVREYLVWRVWDQAVDWYELRDGRFERLPADDDGITRSRVFPGLWLDTAALLRGDLARVIQVVQQGVDSPAHAQFVADLRRRAGQPPGGPTP